MFSEVFSNLIDSVIHFSLFSYVLAESKSLWNSVWTFSCSLLCVAVVAFLRWCACWLAGCCYQEKSALAKCGNISATHFFWYFMLDVIFFLVAANNNNSNQLCCCIVFSEVRTILCTYTLMNIHFFLRKKIAGLWYLILFVFRIWAVMTLGFIEIIEQPTESNQCTKSCINMQVKRAHWLL